MYVCIYIYIYIIPRECARGPCADHSVPASRIWARFWARTAATERGGFGIRYSVVVIRVSPNRHTSRSSDAVCVDSIDISAPFLGSATMYAFVPFCSFSCSVCNTKGLIACA